jgi:coenzyme F420-reducing hydrogenase delta subunit
LKACIFYCSNNADPRHWGVRSDEKDAINTIALPCSGKVDVPYLVKAMETGAEAVVVVACGKEECRHFEGSARAHKRAEAVESLLKEFGFPGGRIAVVECAPGGAERAGREINEFFEHTRNKLQGPSTTGALNPPQHMVA